MRIRWLPVAVVVAVLTWAGPVAAHEDHGRTLPRSDVAFIDAGVANQIATSGLVGVTVSVDAPGRGRFLRSYGLANLQTKRRLTPADHFRIASVTKTFTATAILELVDRDRLGLDDRLDRHVHGVPNGHLITIRELLAMRSGAFDFVGDKPFLDAYNTNPLLPGWQPEDIIPILQRHNPSFPPGERTEYSNSNYVLLGLVLEKVTHEPAERFIRDHVIRPLGLHATSFPTTAAMPRPVARGYDNSFGPVKDFTFTNPDVPWTAGAMISTVPDLTRYAKALASGELLSDHTQRERLAFGTIPSPGGPRVRYGLGILQIGDWIGHNGSIFGYSNTVFYLPQHNATVVVMVNKSSTTLGPEAFLFLDIAQHLYPDSLPTS